MNEPMLARSARRLLRGGQCIGDTRSIEPVMAELRSIESAEQQNRHEIAETRLDRGVRVDVYLGDIRAGGLCERRQRVAHLVTEVAIRTDEKREMD